MTLEELWELFPIVLKERNPEYADWYRQEKNNLIQILGGNIFRINHIGSSAVAGLYSKPTVDILLELAEGCDFDAAAQLLEENGWMLMKRDTSESKYSFNKGYTPKGFAERVYHLHVRPSGDWGELYFRDYLRQHAGVAKEYGELKARLLEQFKHDRDAYTDAKTEFVTKHTQRARAEFAGRYVF